MIRGLLRLLGLGGPDVPCWCGKMHAATYWHDPTHGRIDRDIQEHARELLDLPANASSLSKGLAAVEETMQERRARGVMLYWERDDQVI